MGVGDTQRNESCRELLRSLNASPWRVAIVAAGGGSAAIGSCFRFPGASRTFVEAVIPYAEAAMADYLAGPPVAGSASAETALQLADRAFDRARRFLDLPAEGTAAGLACVAALPTDRPRRGEDRAHVVLQTDRQTHRWQVMFTPDKHTRNTAESIVDAVVFAALAELVGRRRQWQPESNATSTIEHVTESRR